MADKLMYIPNNNKQNYFFCRLQLVVKTFGHSTNKIHRSDKPLVNKMMYIPNNNS